MTSSQPSHPLPRPAAEDFALIVVEPHGELMNRAYAQRNPEIHHEPRDQLSGLDQASVLADITAALEAAEALRGRRSPISWRLQKRCIGAGND